MKNKSGFTLIELLVVIAVIGALSAGVLTAINVVGSLGKANLAKAKTFSASVKNGLAIDQIGEWSFELVDASNITQDTSGYGNNGIVSGAAWKTAEQCGLGFGACLSFDGNNDYVQINNASILNPTNEIALTAWIKMSVLPSVAHSEHILTKWSISDNKRQYMIFVSTNDKFYFTLSPDGNWSSSYEIPSDQSLKSNAWYFVVGTLQNGVMKTYVNGVFQQATASFPASIYSSDIPVIIGGRADFTQYFQGFIDEAAIYSHALSTQNIQQIYAQGLIKRYLAYK